jgi:hypothetical protein
MKIDPPTNALRQDLQRITDQYVGNEGVPRQPGLIEQLRSDSAHRITLEKPAVPGRPETFNFTCYQFALDIKDSAEIRSIAHKSGHCDAKVGNRFAYWLVREKLIERPHENVSDGDLIVYLDDRRAKHAGVVRGDRIVSKWGTSHMWQHAIHEVPGSFGDEVRFFRRPEQAMVIDWFREYAMTLA